MRLDALIVGFKFTKINTNNKKYEIYESSINVNQGIDQKTKITENNLAHNKDDKKHEIHESSINLNQGIDQKTKITENNLAQNKDEFLKDYQKTFLKYQESLIKNKKSNEKLEKYFTKQYPVEKTEKVPKMGRFFPIDNEAYKRLYVYNGDEEDNSKKP